MNIKQAKEQITNAIRAYRTKDEYGRMMIPQQRQRPVFLVGAPGLGKTAIMEQIAAEMEIPLVSYAMTHHTRQSALGLPFIRDEEFGGREYRVSEYTMSEIIADVYRKMKETGKSEGILFLDEINCVSETLAPSMLQFLQYKVFGQHKVPEGWIIVTAGNPPEYNASVREFDMATMDRVKRIDVEPDLEVWRQFAYNTAVHPAVISYLEIYKDDFVKVQKSVDGLRFVTPRSWVDLSDMLRLYEQNKIKVDRELIRQYLQDDKIARNFAAYYDLFIKYRSDYQVDKIIAGKYTPDLVMRAHNAKFDERLSLISMLLSQLSDPVHKAMIARDMLQEAQKALISIRRSTGRKTLYDALISFADETKTKLEKELAGNMVTRNAEEVKRGLIRFLTTLADSVHGEENAAKAFETLRQTYNERLQVLRSDSKATKQALENAFAFVENAFGEGQEMLIFVTELTRNGNIALFIAHNGCDAYFRHNKELLFYERQVKVIGELRQLDDMKEME